MTKASVKPALKRLEDKVNAILDCLEDAECDPKIDDDVAEEESK